MKGQSRIPLLPLSALIFYLCVLSLWKIGLIPSPQGVLLWLEGLYVEYGLIGLFIASFLEGIVYLGLYFPGSFIVAIAVILSDGSLKSLLSISLVVALALTITSSINYLIGRYRISPKIEMELIEKEKKIISNGLISSMLHPNSLAFYFFNSGIRKHNFRKIIFVPIIMIPYGLALGYVFYFFKDGLRTAIESPYIMITAISIWFLIALVLQKKN